MVQKHSGAGIASCILGIVAVGFLLFGVLLFFILENPRYGGFESHPLGFVVLGCVLFAYPAFALLAVALGIAGLLQKNRKKLFAILGSSFITLVLFLTALWMIASFVIANLT